MGVYVPGTRVPPDIIVWPEAEKPADNRWAALAVLCGSVLLVSMDATVLNVVMPVLSQDLSVSSSDQLWIVASYALIAGSLLITFGALGDKFGRRRLLLAGFGLFAVGSSLAGVAQQPTLLIVARGLLGAGGAMVMPATLALLRTTFTDRRELSVAFAIWGTVAGAGSAIGPLVGGSLLSVFGWRAAFLVNIPWVLLVGAGALIFIKESRSQSRVGWDTPSALLATIAVLLMASTAFQIGTGEYFLGLLMLAAASSFFYTFAVRQELVDYPMVPPRLLKDRRLASVFFAVGTLSFCMVGLQFVLTQYLQLVVGVSPVEVGVRLLPGVVGGLIGTQISGFAGTRLGGPRKLILAGLSITIAALMPIYFMQEGKDQYVVLSLVLFLAGLGSGIALVAGIDAIIGGIEEKLVGIASAFQETSMQIGAGMGTAILGVAANSSYQSALQAADPRQLASRFPEVQESLSRAVQKSAELEGDDKIQLLGAAKTAFVQGVYSSVNAAIAALVVALLMVVLFLRGWSIAGDHQERVGSEL